MNNKSALNTHYYFLFLLLLWSDTLLGQNLFFSEYVEGTSNNKCIEIFNPTSQAVKLTDVYRIVQYRNGSTSPKTLSNLSGTIAAKGTHVVCDVTLGIFADQLFVAGPNGDDAFTLECNGAAIDVFGSIGCDPGDGWTVDGQSTKDVTLRKKACVNKGAIGSGGCSFPGANDWTALPVNTTNGLGTHDFGVAEVEILGNNALCENSSITLEATEGFASFQWSNGSNGRTITVSSAGNYSVTAITAQGCKATDSKRINGQSPEIFADITNIQNVSCRPKKDGGFTVKPSGGSGGFSYAWEFGSGTSPMISGLGAGTYNVTVSDNNGCAITVPVEIDGPVEVPLTVDERGETCRGRGDGQMTLFAEGDNLEFSIDNQTFSSQTIYTDLLPGDYPVTVRDETGCGDEKRVYISAGTIFNLRESIITQAKCQGEGGGQIILQPEGGKEPYEVSFDGRPFRRQLTFSDLKADTFDITIRDASGCAGSFQQEIEPGSDLLVKDYTITPATCVGVDDGGVVFETEGGGGVVAFFFTEEDGTGISRPYFQPEFTDLGVGKKYMFVRDSEFDCRIPIEFEIQERDPLFTNVVSPLPCAADQKGMITVLPQNGDAPYQYSLDSADFINDNIFTDLDPMEYVVTTKDGRGCMKVDSVNFGVVADFEIAFVNPRHESCAGNEDGQITIATNSANLFQYSIDGINFEDNNIFSGLAPNDYTVYVQSSGCQDTASITILPASPIRLNGVEPKVAVCAGDDDGQLTVSVSGGKLPYLYQLDNGPFQSDNVFTNLAAGVYEITVRDSNLCEQIFTDVTLAEPTRLEVDCKDVQNVTTFEGTDGQVHVTIFGGTSPYDVQLVNAGFNNVVSLDGSVTFENLPAGDYQVQVLDKNNCTSTCSFSITQPLCDFSINTTSTTPTCYDSLNGTIRVVVPMTNDPLTISWSDTQYNGQQILTGLAAGTYWVTVSDPIGCVDSSQVTLVAPDTLSVEIIADNETICSKESAQLTLSTTYADYLWSNNENTSTIAVGVAGTYQVTVKDAVGCTATDAVTINVIQQDTFYENRFTCDIASVGTFELEERGANGCIVMIIRTFELARKDTTDLAATTCDPAQVGTVPTMLTNAFGCDSLIRTTYNLLRSDTTYLDQMSCRSENVGMSRVILSNAVGCDSLLIVETTLDQTVEQTFLTEFTCNPLDVGIDTIFTSTLGGCDSLVITNTISNASAITELAATACDPANVRVDTFSLLNKFACDSLVIVNTTLAETHFLPLVEETCNPQDTGLVTQFLINQFGCDSIVAIQTNLAAINSCSIGFTALADTVCWGESMGVVDISINIGNPPFDYYVLNDFFGDTLHRGTIDMLNQQIESVPVGQYAIVLVNPQNITQKERVQIVQSSEIDIQATFSDYYGATVSCEGEQDGSINLHINGGRGPYTFQWETGEQIANLQNLAIGNYIVTITDAANCTNTASFDLTASDELGIDFQTFSPKCFGDAVGEITIFDLPNAKGRVEYSLDGTLFQPIDPLPFTIEKLAPADYQLFIQDENDCQASTDFTIPMPLDNQLTLGAVKDLVLGDSLIIIPDANFVIDRFEWTANVPLTCVDCLELKTIPTKAGQYKLTAFDTSGCSVSATVNVNLRKETTVYLPNAFSPNADGLNDVYQIFMDNSVTQLNSLRIFDYEGRLMYQAYNRSSNDSTVGWDGEFNGQKMLPAVFVVFAEVELLDGTTRTYSQTMTLVK